MPVERFTDLEAEGLVGRDGLGGRIVGERGERRRRGMQRGQLYQTHAHNAHTRMDDGTCRGQERDLR